MPSISVIIPLYNRSGYLERAIDSVLYQTYDNYEVIIVDDGSTDNVKDTVEHCISKSPSKIRYIYQDNKGAGAARNTGIKYSNGRLIAFLDADDEWLPTYLEKSLRALEDNQCDWVCSGSCRVVLDDDDNELYRENILTEPLSQHDNLYNALLSENNFVGGPSQVVVKKDCFKQVGCYREDLPVREDWELWIRLAQAGLKVCKVVEPLYIYKIRENSITKTDRAIGIGSSYKIFCQYSKEAFAIDPSYRLLYAEKLWNLARHLFYAKNKDYFLMLKCMIRSQLFAPSIKRLRQSMDSVNFNNNRNV